MNAIFIPLDYNLDDVMYYRNGIDMSIYRFLGVRLLPNQTYTQRTDTPTGMVLDNPTVELLSMCGNVIAEITDNFTVLNTFSDPITGLQQIYWQVKDLPDIGEMVYLRINNGIDAFVYSSPFMLGGILEDEVQPYRFDYRNNILDTMQGIGLDIYYKKDAEIFEQSSYTTLGGDQQVTLTIQLLEYEVCRTGIIDYKALRLIKRMFCFRYLYCNYQQATLIQPIETPDFTASENFVQAEIQMQRNASVIYDPNYVPPAPPPPPLRQIILNNVQPFNNTQVTYNFELINLPATYLTYQYSLDEINWISNTTSPESPKNRVIPNYQTNTYYYRIYSPEFDVYSDVVKIDFPQIVITNISSTDSAWKPLGGNKYIVSFDLIGFTPSQQLSFEASPTGNPNDWIYGSGISYPQGNESPKIVTTFVSGFEFKYFRIRYSALNLLSNEEYFQF